MLKAVGANAVNAADASAKIKEKVKSHYVVILNAIERLEKAISRDFPFNMKRTLSNVFKVQPGIHTGTKMYHFN